MTIIMSSSKYARTDLAVEMIDPDKDSLPKGIKRRIRKSSVCTVTEITVTDDIAGIRIGKPKGTYITIETDRLSAHPEDCAGSSYRQKGHRHTAYCRGKCGSCAVGAAA